MLPSPKSVDPATSTVNTVVSNNFSGIIFPSNNTHSVFSNTQCIPFDSNSWILDTGATDHMVPSINCFTSSACSINASVKLPNSQFVVVTHISYVSISEHLVLHDVLCIPTFYFKLIYISKLTQSLTCSFLFSSYICLIQDLIHWRLIFFFL